MSKLNLSRRRLMQATAGSVAAAGLVDGLLDPNSAWAQSSKQLRVRSNRAILSTDPGYMIGGFEMVLQYACLARLAKYTNSPDEWGWGTQRVRDVVGAGRRPDDHLRAEVRHHVVRRYDP